jgi:hypothetical protein
MRRKYEKTQLRKKKIFYFRRSGGNAISGSVKIINIEAKKWRNESRKRNGEIFNRRKSANEERRKIEEAAELGGENLTAEAGAGEKEKGREKRRNERRRRATRK